ncbi:snRNA-activating protein complex subunit 4 [Anableps anableps]
MSDSLSARRDRVQRQVEELERSLAVTQTELDLLSSETDDGSESEDQQDAVGQSPADLLAQKEKIQTEIQNLEDMLGSHRPISVSSEDSSDSSDESDLDLSPSVDSCLQLNLVYQQVVQETLDHLETLLTQNQKQQRELTAQMNGPIRESREGSASSNQHPAKLFLGSFLKPYFKDRLTGLGPPANQEAKLKALRMMGCPDDKKLRVKRWESWQKTLLIHSVTRDRLKRLMQPKLSRLDFLTKKLSAAQGADRQQLTEQIDGLEKEIQLLRRKREEELIGDRYEEHDWQKISNIDFEGTKDAENIRLFWQNVLHPSINKAPWSSQEVQELNQLCRTHQERHWEAIAQELGTGRTAFMCLQMFQRFVSDSLRRSSWTPEEDEQLRELVQKMRIGSFIPYTQISYFMEGRDTAQLIYRWNQVLDPSLKKGPWTQEEDRRLLQAVARHGEKCWWKVRLEVPGRTDGACRDRYLDCLKKNIKKGAFERHEVELLKELVKKHGVGRWAKIAAEIPHRFDAQCMREWRKLVRSSAQDGKRRVRKTRTTAGAGRGRSAGAARVNIRRRILKIKQEEEEQISEEEQEDEDEVVPYMDSDEDSKKKRERSVEEEEQQREYVLPPMEDWIPAEVKQTSTSLNFQLVELPSSCDAADGTAVRSTVLGKPGPSVIVGPPPRELPRQERHRSSAMLMASREALRLHLSAMKQKFSTPPQPGRRPRPRPQELRYELQAAVTPWIGNLLIPQSRTKTAGDVLRERGERSGVSTSSAFLLLLQAMNVDTLGCRQMIEERKNTVDLLAPPPAPGPKRVSELLRSRRSRRRQEEDDQRRLMLQQLQEALQEKQWRPLLQGPPQRHQLLLQGPPQRHQLLLQGPPQRHQLLLQGPPQRHQLLLPAGSICFVPVRASPPGPPDPVLPNPKPTCNPCSAVPVGSSSTSNLAAAVGSSQGSAGSSAELRGVGGASEGAAVGGADAGVQRGEEGAKLQESSQKEGAVLDSEPEPMTTACSPEPDPTEKSDSAAVSSASPCAGVGSSSPSCTDEAPPTSTNTPIHQSGGRKRRRVEVGGAGPGVIQEGKRPRRPTLKIRESMELQATEKKRSSSSSSKQKSVGRSHSKGGTGTQAPPLVRTTGFRLLPNQSMWVMTPTGPVPLVQAPPPALQVGLTQNAPPPVAKAPPTLTAGSSSMNPAASPALHEPQPSPVLPTCNVKPRLPTVLQSHDDKPTPSPQPPPKIVLPYQGVIKVDPMRPPPLRRVAVHFDPGLMFLDPPEAVHDWLSGRGGVAVPGARCALPYLPPFVSTLSALSGLLQAKTSLTTTSLQLLTGADQPRCPQPHPDHAYCASDEPHSTSAAEEQPGQQEEQVKAVRQLVAERFSTNPAYQQLKARFLSLFTVPALLATVQPVSTKKPHCPTNQEEEEEDEDEEELRKIQERGRRRRAERSSLLSDDSAASASHFSGICTASRPSASPDPLPQNQSMQADPN